METLENKIDRVKREIDRLRYNFILIGRANRQGGGVLILEKRFSSGQRQMIDTVDEDLKQLILFYYDQELKALEKELDELLEERDKGGIKDYVSS